MTLQTSGYTVGSNFPLNHARILYGLNSGTVVAGGTGGELALNEFTSQRWQALAGNESWLLTLGQPIPMDMLAIAAHNIGTTGSTVLIETAAAVGGPYAERANLSPTDDSTIAVLFNNAGAPITVAEIRVTVDGPPNVLTIGHIRGGVALQMARPALGGLAPLGLSRAVETRHAMTETGQWKGRMIQRQARKLSMSWAHLPAPWVRSDLAPFLNSLPQSTFIFLQNPLRMPESVALCWTDVVPIPQYMGIKNLMSLSMEITGFLE